MTIDATRTAGRARLAMLGELVTVYDADGDGRAVTAVVDRQPRVFGDPPRGPSEAMHVELLNDATRGVTGSEWNARWTIDVAPRPGAAAVRKRLVRPVKQSVGMIVFEVR